MLWLSTGWVIIVLSLVCPQEMDDLFDPTGRRQKIIDLKHEINKRKNEAQAEIDFYWAVLQTKIEKRASM